MTSTTSKFVIGNCIRSHLVISTRHVPKDTMFYGLCIISSDEKGEVKIRSSTNKMDAVTTLVAEDISVDGLKSGASVCADASSLSRAIDSFGGGIRLDMSISDSGSDMLVNLPGSTDDSQTVPLASSQSVPPDVSPPDKGVFFKCSIGMLVSAIGRIKFALPVSDVSKHYSYIKTIIHSDHVRIVAGNGQCFARTNFAISESKTSKTGAPVFMPARELLKVADYLANNFDDEDTVTVTFAKDRIGFECDNFFAVVSSASDGTISWPEENDILTRDSATKLLAEMADWSSVQSGIRAVFELENDSNSLCRTKLTVDKGGTRSVFATGNRNVSKRTIFLSADSKVNPDAISGVFASSIFCEVIKAAKGCNKMVLELDNSKFRGYPSPVIMRSYTDAHEEPVIESFFSQFS
jgi:DNA polymerase III sliding clamp (beta) subunit (PCNA family)